MGRGKGQNTPIERWNWYIHESEHQERGGASIGSGAGEAHRREHDGEAMGLADRLAAIDKDCAARLKEPFRSADHGELLYDERGLPR